MSDDKKPAIRFKDYSDDWEQRKFSEMVIIERGGSPRPIDKFITNDENGLNWVKIGDAPEQGNYITKTAEKIKSEGLSKTREVHPGDLILSNSMSFGRPYIMAINGCIHDGWLAIRNTEKRFDLKFLCTLLGTDSMLDQYKAMAAGSTVNNLNKELVGSTTVSFPKIDEQVKIGEYFANLDNLIALHQRKYDKLQNLKKAMLEKMFPKNGSNVPEIRFKGFTDAWEQRKLGNMMDVTSVKRIHQSDWTDSGVRFLRARDIVAESKNEEVSEPIFISQEKYDEYSAVSGKVEKGDLLVTGVGTIGVPMLINSEEPLYFKDGNIIWFKNKNAIDGRFFYHSFKDLNIQKFIKESAGTGTVGTYTIENGKKTPINLPLQKEEQEKIGEYFSNLDNLIALHQRELEKLKNIKKAMLEKMFV